MKKLLIILCFAASTFSAGFAQRIKDADVPQTVKNVFTKSYPGLNAKWEKENGNYEARFKKDGKLMSATFQPDGKFLKSEMVIKESELPAVALNYIKTNYKGKRVKESFKITGADGVVSFEAEIDDRDVIFDANGKYLREDKD
jgi:hypothetical protein